jgi:hypothetical protein
MQKQKYPYDVIGYNTIRYERLLTRREEEKRRRGELILMDMWKIVPMK